MQVEARRMKAYIAGKITGDALYKMKFAHAQVALDFMGYIVLNPAHLPEGMRPIDYMKICIMMIDAADVVVFLADYEESKGAMLEHSWCEYCGKEILYLEIGVDDEQEGNDA